MATRKEFGPKIWLQMLCTGHDEDYKEFFNHIAEHEHVDMIDIERIMGVIKNPFREDAIIVAREMEKIGVGKFVKGRRGSPTRLEWHFRSDSVGKVARGELDELVPIATKDQRGDNMANESIGDSLYISHSFRLRPEETVRFDLPCDLSQTEASRLSDFIQSLPFERV